MLTLPDLAPGIVRDASALSAKGGYVEGNNVRFVRAAPGETPKPEIIGGWEAATSSAVSGMCRGVHAWSGNSGTVYVALGTHTHLYAYTGGGLYDITPAEVQATGTLGVDPFAVTSGSATVTVTAVAHNQVVGKTVFFAGATAGGGITISGAYTVTTVPGANSFTITHSAAATATDATTGGSAVTYQFFRAVLTNPFDTTNGSAVVTVNHTTHGRAAGDRVVFDGATAVGGITISGAYTVTTVVNANSFTITHSSAATSTVVGGGGTVGYEYLLPVGLANGIGGLGYGTGTYGTGTYGAASTGDYFPRTWCLDNFGPFLIANPRGRTIYEWQLNTDCRATPVLNAPSQVTAMFVDPAARVVACGANEQTSGTFNPLLVRHSDQEAYTDWSASETDQAGEYPLRKGSRLVRGLAGRGGNLLLTDSCVFLQRDLNDASQVYDYVLLGENCGLIGPNAVTQLAGALYWMTPAGQFYRFAGAAPEQLLCPVREYVFDDLAFVQQDKIVAGTIAAYDEVIWFYASRADATNEISRYVSVNVREGWWQTGTVARTAWVDAGTLPSPLGVDTSGMIYFHERGTSANGAPITASVKSAPVELGDGDTLLALYGMVPDFHGLQGGLSLTLFGKIYPADVEREHGPYTILSTTRRVHFRATARQLAFRISSSAVPTKWRFGSLRFDAKPTGQKR